MGDVIPIADCLDKAVLNFKSNANNDASAFRWLFNPTAKAVIHTQDDYAGMIEVTEDFARYVQDQPDCECELKEVKPGDEYLILSPYQDWCVAVSDMETRDKTPPLRWCKPCVRTEAGERCVECLKK